MHKLKTLAEVDHSHSILGTCTGRVGYHRSIFNLCRTRIFLLRGLVAL